MRAWADGRFPDEIDRMAQDYGRFEPVEQFFPRADVSIRYTVNDHADLVAAPATYTVHAGKVGSSLLVGYTLTGH